MRNEKHKILHMLADLTCNGTQTWLYNLLRFIDRDRFELAFLVRDASPELFVQRFSEFGAKIYCVPGKVDGHRVRVRHLNGVRNVLTRYGPFQVMQSHEGLNSGPYFLLAKRLGVPVRIVHSHGVDVAMKALHSLSKLGVRWTKKQMTLRYATCGFASSSRSAAALFGVDWTTDSRWQTFFCGLDLSPFEQQGDRVATRASLGIPDNVSVIGHVGRFVKTKNHKKLLNVFKAVLRTKADVHLLLVGDGPLLASIKKNVRRDGLEGRVHFTGLRTDVPMLMRDGMDMFVFPSLYEGLGLAYVEAQAAGLPCIVSDAVPPDADVVRGQLTRLPVTIPDEDWAEAVNRAAFKGRSQSNLQLFSRFDIRSSVKFWENLYANAARGSSIRR